MLRFIEFKKSFCVVWLLFYADLLDPSNVLAIQTQNSKEWSATGQLKLVDDIPISIPFAGIVSQVLVSEGAIVVSGQTVVTLDDAIAKSEMDAARASLHSAELESQNDVDLRFSQLTAQVRQNELERSKSANLLFSKSVSAVELQRLELVVQQAQLSAEQAQKQRNVALETVKERQAKLDAARLRFERCTVKSPLGGTVVEIPVKQRQWVSDGAVVIRVINTNRLRFESLVSVEQSEGMHAGDTVLFSLSEANHVHRAADESYRGKLLLVSPEVNPVSSQLRIIAEIENKNGKLKPGLKGKIVCK